MDDISKFLAYLTKKEKDFFLGILFPAIQKLDLERWDVKPLKGYKGLFRVKKGKIRVVFLKDSIRKKGVIVDIDYRKDIYKKL